MPQAVDDVTCSHIGEAGYSLGRVLGEGRFSQVVLGTNDATGEFFAVKVIDRTALEEDEEAGEALRVEVEVLKRAASHPHIVALHAVIRTPEAIYLVMELMEGGELFDAIIARGSFSEAEARRLLRQLLGALAYCHKAGVVHRDLKPENVLFADEGISTLKLIDFGYAAIQQRPGEPLHGLSGTPDYVAPEVLSWYEGDAEVALTGPRIEYDASCDMWSVGVILYILLCGFPPFYAEAEPDLIAKVRSGHFEFTEPYWTNISAGAKDLIRRCLQVDPKRRPRPVDALRHPWLSSGSEVDSEASEPSAAELSAAEVPAPVPSAPAPAAREPAAAEARAAPASHPRQGAYAESPPPATPTQPTPDGDGGRGGGNTRAVPVMRAASAGASADSGRVPTGTESERGELIARIRQMRQSYVPRSAESRTASRLQMTMEPEGGATFAVPPSVEELSQQGATFVKLPRELFQDLYVLCDAQRRGLLHGANEQRLNQLLIQFTGEVQNGHVGKRQPAPVV